MHEIGKELLESNALALHSCFPTTVSLALFVGGLDTRKCFDGDSCVPWFLLEYRMAIEFKWWR